MKKLSEKCFTNCNSRYLLFALLLMFPAHVANAEMGDDCWIDCPENGGETWGCPPGGCIVGQ